jgi:hypothetical protein
MPVLVEDAAEAVPSVDVKPGGGVRLGDGCRQCVQRPGVGDSLMGPVGVVELLELAQCVQQVRAWFQIRVRSSGSRRQVCTHRSMTALPRIVNYTRSG